MRVVEHLTKKRFSRIYDEHMSKIYRFIYYKTYQKETAEDLTSQTFLKAMENWEKYDTEKGSIQTWLFQIARNTVIDYFRKLRKTVDIQDVWDLAGEGDIEVDLQNREQLNEIKAVLKDFPMEHRDILIMRIWQDMPYKEIALVLGKSEASCKMSFSRTIARLRSQLSTTLFLSLILFKYNL